MGANIRGIAAILVVALAWCGAAQAAPITVDSFAQPDPRAFFMVPAGTNPSLAMAQTAAGALGGQRDSLFQVIGQALVNSANGLLGHDTNFNINAFQLATINPGPTVATLQYSGTNNGNTATTMANAHNLGGGLGVNLVDGTNDRFQIQFFTCDALPNPLGLDMAITITSPGGLTSTLTKDAPNSQSAFACDFPFSQFVGNADFTHVDSVRVAFNGARQTPNVDFEVRGIIAVPEPTSLLTMTLGGAIFGAVQLFNRKRRRSA
jgi:hypothetical protein